jgi:hypothetical protein
MEEDREEAEEGEGMELGYEGNDEGGGMTWEDEEPLEDHDGEQSYTGDGEEGEEEGASARGSPQQPPRLGEADNGQSEVGPLSDSDDDHCSSNVESDEEEEDHEEGEEDEDGGDGSGGEDEKDIEVSDAESRTSSEDESEGSGDEAHQFVNRLSEVTLRKVQFMRLCQDLGLSNGGATKMLKFFKSIGKIVENFEWTMDALAKNVGKSAYKHVRVRQIRVSKEVTRVVGGPPHVTLV